MKKLFTLLFSVAFASAVFAQTNHQLEFQAGVNIPTLDYADNYAINSYTGFAKTGVYTSASYSPLFGRVIIPKVQFFYGFNPFDKEAFYTQIKKAYAVTPNLRVSSFDAFSYSFVGFAAGPGFKTRGASFYVRCNVLIAFVHQSHPELRAEGKDLSDMKDWSDVLVQTSHNSYGGILELGFYKSLNNKTFLSLNSSIFGSPFDFNQDGTFSKSGEANNHYQKPRQGEIDNVNITLGISYLLKEPKSRPIVVF